MNYLVVSWDNRDDEAVVTESSRFTNNYFNKSCMCSYNLFLWEAVDSYHYIKPGWVILPLLHLELILFHNSVYNNWKSLRYIIFLFLTSLFFTTVLSLSLTNILKCRNNMELYFQISFTQRLLVPRCGRNCKDYELRRTDRVYEIILQTGKSKTMDSVLGSPLTTLAST